MQPDIVTPLASFGGSTVAGFLAGYAVMKLLKIFIKFILIGAGVMVALFMYFGSIGWFTGVNYNKIGNDVYALANNTLSTVSTTDNPITGFVMSQSVFVTSGLAVGFVAGAALGLR